MEYVKVPHTIELQPLKNLHKVSSESLFNLAITIRQSVQEDTSEHQLKNEFHSSHRHLAKNTLHNLADVQQILLSQLKWIYPSSPVYLPACGIYYRIWNNAAQESGWFAMFQILSSIRNQANHIFQSRNKDYIILSFSKNQSNSVNPGIYQLKVSKNDPSLDITKDQSSYP